MLAWLVKERQIAPHIPVYDTSKRVEGALRRTDFAFDPERDQYTCPGGKLLMQHRRNYTIPRSGITKDGARLYRASKLDCERCHHQTPLLPEQACPNDPATPP